MRYRRLGKSGVCVSPICFGTMLFGNPVREPEAERLIHQALDLGINFIDTASSYQGYDRSVGSRGGVAEEYLGRILKGKRQQVVLLTKIGNAIGPDPHDKGGSRIHLQRELEHCLRRLQSECIDVLMLHWPDVETPLEESLRTLDLFVRQGKIRYFGVSNFLSWQMCRLLWLSDRLGLEKMVACELPYSILRRDIEASEIPFCQEFGIGIACYQVLQGGWLSGRYHGPQPASEGRLAEKPGWLAPLPDAIWPRLEALSKLPAEVGVGLPEYAIAWALRRPEISSAVLGIRTPEHLASAMKAADLAIPDEHLQKIDELFPLPMDLRWSSGAPKIRVWQ